MTEAAHWIATILYLVAGAAGWAALRGFGSGVPVPWLLGIGVVPHAAGFVALHLEDPPVPLESFAASLSLIGWLVPVAYLMSLRFARVRGVGMWVAATAALMTAISALGLSRGVPLSSGDSQRAWSHAHVLISTLGFSMLALTSLAGLAYLAKERALKRKSLSRFGLPSLESLDRMEHLTLSLGFPLLTLGVLSGFAWSATRGPTLWTGHSLWLVLAWGVYLVPVGMRVVRRQHGERPARSVVLGFCLLAFAYIGVRLLGGGA